MRRMLQVLVLVCWCVALPSADSLDQLIEKALAQFQVPGAAVALVVDGETVLCRGYGTRRVGEDLPVTEETLFPVASCTKAMTALLLGQLVDQGLVSWDDPVVQHIPEFCLTDTEVSDQVTIRDLLAHRTGVERHDLVWQYGNLQRDELLERLQHLDAPLGLRKEYQYNNLMYALAGLLVERVTGRPWEQVLQERLLWPAGMTGVTTSPEELGKHFAYPHAELNGRVKAVPFPDLSAIKPAGGANANIRDMTRWLQLQLGQGEQGVINEATLREMQTMQMPLPPADWHLIFRYGYGLGWCMAKYRGHDAIGHAGHIAGFAAEVTFLPAERIGLVILTNNSSAGHAAISIIRNRLLDRALGLEEQDWTQRAVEQHTRSTESVQRSLDAYESIVRRPGLSKAILKQYVGSYQHPAYGVVEVTREQGHLRLSYEALDIPLYAKSEDTFVGKFDAVLLYGMDPIATISFVRHPETGDYQLHLPSDGSFKGLITLQLD